MGTKTEAIKYLIRKKRLGKDHKKGKPLAGEKRAKLAVRQHSKSMIQPEYVGCILQKIPPIAQEITVILPPVPKTVVLAIRSG